jgi:hypothetical protein
VIKELGYREDGQKNIDSLVLLARAKRGMDGR